MRDLDTVYVQPVLNRVEHWMATAEQRYSVVLLAQDSESETECWVPSLDISEDWTCWQGTLSIELLSSFPPGHTPKSAQPEYNKAVSTKARRSAFRSGR